MARKMFNAQLSPVVHDLKKRGVLSCANDVNHDDVGRTDAFTQEVGVSLLNRPHPLASPRAARRSPRTFRRGPHIDLRRSEEEPSEKLSESSLQPLQNTVHLQGSLQAAWHSPRTFRRGPYRDMRRSGEEVNEKPSKSCLQSPQNLTWKRSVHPPTSTAGAGCTSGMSVTKHSTALEAAPCGVDGLPVKLSETAPVSSPRSTKKSCSRPVKPCFHRALG